MDVKTAPGAGVPPNSHPGDNDVFCTQEMHLYLRHRRRGTHHARGRCGVHAERRRSCPDEHRRQLGGMCVFNAPSKIHAAFFTGLGEPMPQGARDFPSFSDNPPDIPRLIVQAQALGVTIHH
ncbi:cupin domain-containing protein [Rhizobium sp. BR 315]|uniref:cupin domain-containing protein n=1 Tax=Rhizobium sp. BR 315 TaxID=3040014 RepID=UPI003D32BAF1